MRHVESNSYTRMYISRRKCEMVLAVAKKHHPVARRLLGWLLGGSGWLLGGC